MGYKRVWKKNITYASGIDSWKIYTYDPKFKQKPVK